MSGLAAQSHLDATGGSASLSCSTVHCSPALFWRRFRQNLGDWQNFEPFEAIKPFVAIFLQSTEAFVLQAITTACFLAPSGVVQERD